MLPLVLFGILLACLPFSCNSLQNQGKLLESSALLPNPCNETCGKHHIPFPFYMNSSCMSISSSFHLSCSNSSSLLLKINSETYPVIEFFPDGVLVDFPGSLSCRQYNDLNSFGKSLVRNEHFGVSVDNVIGLYDCEDSSLCRADCETVDLPGCDGSNGGGGGSLGCCYPLSDHSIWRIGQGFSVFSQFGCRGFSSWAVLRGSNSGKRGVKLEWAIPKNSSDKICSRNAEMVNATAVDGGARCACQDGYVGDGFANGTGCLQSCIKDGQEAYGSDCYIRRKDQRKFVIIAGILGPVLIVGSLVALFYLLKRPVKPGMFDTEQAYYHHTSFQKACRARLFSHHELEEATKDFEEGQKLMHSSNNGTIFAGVIGDGSHIAVHKLQCENEKDLIQALSQIEVLSTIVHRNMARLLGCCIDSGYPSLVVYEYPANGTLEEHLHQSKGQKVLDWYRRLTIAAETASVLAFLQYENSPPIFHHNLKSGCIFLDDDFTVKIAGFGLINSKFNNGYDNNIEGLRLCKNDVYDMGVVLLEIISGSNHLDSPTLALQKIRAGKLEEIIDPLLYHHEQPHSRQEQIQKIADLATRCLLFGADGKLGMIDVARELIHITKECVGADGGIVRGPALEETFSNSSLLQMISMSPDSMYIP
ncbi:putative inactive receptor-like protein kinase [Senna tora]|uniref:Putative inactive receptor-like protein kinase n=1 Tax=Senna tora TaxID=362788 RepID=A0A834SD03_9FABA|nr:putative inactive receptor-like protein kinase [Senna tora]